MWKKLKSSVCSALITMSRMEIAVLILILLWLAALLIPANPQWASSGEIELPVHVRVFDAMNEEPIPNTDVLIVRSSPAASRDSNFDDYSERFADDVCLLRNDPAEHVTGSDGTVVIQQVFRTGASHRRPQAHAQINYYWVIAHHDQFGTAIVPVGYETVSTKLLKQQQELFVLVPLIKPDEESTKDRQHADSDMKFEIPIPEAQQ